MSATKGSQEAGSTVIAPRLNQQRDFFFFFITQEVANAQAQFLPQNVSIFTNFMGPTPVKAFR